MVRGAIATLLELEDDLSVVAQVGRGDEVLAAAIQHEPDVAILDIQMPGLDGLSAARLLHEHDPGIEVLMLTTFGRPGYLRLGLEAGVSGFMLKDAPADELADAVRRVAAGERVIEMGLAAAALAEGISPLTSREGEVLRTAGSQPTIADIADSLNLSPGTVRNHLSSAIAKLGAANRIDAFRIARDKGYL